MNAPTQMRLPPQAVDVERHVIGAMLLDTEAVGLALEILKAEDFYIEKHARAFRAASELFLKNQPVDLITLSDTLRRSGDLEKAGGEEYLIEITAEVVSSANLESHCRIVKEKSLLRMLIKSATQMLEKAYSAQDMAKTVMDEAEAEIFSISSSNVRKDLMPIKSILTETVKLIESYSKHELVGIPSGFKDLDAYTSGFQKTDFIVIAARPAMGKTAFALSLVANSAINSGKSVAFFSLEMGREQLVQRILCRQAQINMQLLRSGKLPQRDYPRLSIALGPIAESKIYIDDNPALNIFDLRSKCRKLKAQSGLDMVIIDYLQLMESVGRVENRQQEISQISRGLKGLAKELDIPVIALSQLSRAVEQRGGDKRPQISDLRESGAIEQDADLVMFIFREEVYNPEAEKGKAEIILAKQRNGPIGDVTLTFIPDYASFENYSSRSIEESDGF